MFTPIRELYAMLPESRERGYKPGRFSFNVKGGRCEACQGDGKKRIEMNFLPDVTSPATSAADGATTTKRCKSNTRAIPSRIYWNRPSRKRSRCSRISPHPRQAGDTRSVGLGYLHLGQSSTTLSGGEAQRIKLAQELSRRQTGRTLYILDKPTTGLHFEDMRKLLDVLQNLVELGNTVVVIEHHLDVVKTADWIIDLGPEGGERGGTGRQRNAGRHPSQSQELYRAGAKKGAQERRQPPGWLKGCRKKAPARRCEQAG